MLLTFMLISPNICIFFYRYFQAGGNPEQVIEMLSENYQAVAQMANLMAEWLILAGNVTHCFIIQYTLYKVININPFCRFELFIFHLSYILSFSAQVQV